MRTVTYDENEWALVPKKPTSAMKTVGIGVEVYQDSPTELDSLSWEEVTAIYEAMTAAAPDHPATAGDAEDAARYRWLKACNSQLATLPSELATLLATLQGRVSGEALRDGIRRAQCLSSLQAYVDDQRRIGWSVKPAIARFLSQQVFA
jgi:hypothetical protein